MPRRTNPNADPDGIHEPNSSKYGNDSISFTDAHTELGEIPLNELDQFVIAARDERGLSIHVNLYIPPYMERNIDVILRSGRFPYLRKSDLIRHAIYRHLYWLMGLRHSIPKHILPALDAVLEVCRDEEISTRMEEVFYKIDGRVSGHLSKGDHGEVVRMLNTIKSRMEGVKDSPWVRRYREHFSKQWEPYLRQYHDPGKRGVQ